MDRFCVMLLMLLATSLAIGAITVALLLREPGHSTFIG